MQPVAATARVCRTAKGVAHLADPSIRLTELLARLQEARRPAGQPDPAGVPVNTTSPGNNGTIADSSATNAGPRTPDRQCCSAAPFRRQRYS